MDAKNLVREHGVGSDEAQQLLCNVSPIGSMSPMRKSVELVWVFMTPVDVVGVGKDASWDILRAGQCSGLFR